MSLKYKISLSIIIIVSIITSAILFFLQNAFETRIDKKINDQFAQSKLIYQSFNEYRGENLDLSTRISTYGSVFTENLNLYKRTKTASKKEQEDARETLKYAIIEAQTELETYDLMIALDEDFNSISSNLNNLAINQNYENAQVIQDLFTEVSDDDTLSGYILRPFLHDGKLYLTQANEIGNDLQTEGYVIVGVQVNNGFVRDIKSSISTDISFFNKQEIIASSLHRYKRFDLEEIVKKETHLDSLVTSNSTVKMPLNGEEFLMTYVPVDETGSLYYVLATSYDKEFQTFSDIRDIILIIGGIAIFIGVIFGLTFGNTVVNPIKKLVWAVEEIDKENYNVSLENPSKDEIGVLSKSFNHMAKALGERFELLKFVSKNTHEMIKQKGSGNLKLGGERKYLTMFFSDIRGFTAFSEKREPEEVIEMLNIYLHKQADIVHKYGGDIDKFVGDELMAIFEGEDAELQAVLAAREIQSEIDVLNDKYKNEIFVGIGINAGDVVSGNMGSENRIDHTVLGNNVNLAARLCDKAGRKKTIVSESVYIKIPQKKLLKEIEPISVKGISEPIKIYEVI